MTTRISMKNEGNAVSPDVVVSGSSTSNGRGRHKRKENEEPENPQAAKSARTAKTTEDEKETIVKLVTKDLWSDDSGVVGGALIKLTNLCNIAKDKGADKNRAALYHAGGHLIIIKIVEEQHPILSAEGCRLLGNLVIDDSKFRGQSVGQIGSVEVIIAAMKKHPNYAYLHQCGIGALGNLVISCKDNASRIKKVGGIATVVNSMKTHPEVAPLQLHGCRTLLNLCGWKEYIPLIVEAGGTSAIALAMEEHKDDTGVQNYSRQALKVLF